MDGDLRRQPARVRVGSRKTEVHMQSIHFQSITEKIIGASFEVYNSLGSGYLERVYQNALTHELALQGLHTEREKQLIIEYKGKIVGEYFADIIVNSLVLVETKWTDALTLQHIYQVKHYLKAAKLRVGLRINFGARSLEFKRISPWE